MVRNISTRLRESPKTKHFVAYLDGSGIYNQLTEALFTHLIVSSSSTSSSTSSTKFESDLRAGERGRPLTGAARVVRRHAPVHRRSHGIAGVIYFKFESSIKFSF